MENVFSRMRGWFEPAVDFYTEATGAYAKRLKQIVTDSGTFGLEVEIFAFGGMLPLGQNVLVDWEEHSCSELMLNVTQLVLQTRQQLTPRTTSLHIISHTHAQEADVEQDAEWGGALFTQRSNLCTKSPYSDWTEAQVALWEKHERNCTWGFEFKVSRRTHTRFCVSFLFCLVS